MTSWHPKTLKCLQDKAFSLDCPWWQLRACLPLINGAKANASESELEEIQRLEDEAFEF